MALYLLTLSRTSGDTIVANTTEHLHICGELVGKSTEGASQARARAAWTMSDLYVRVRDNTVTAASTYRFRKNGADGNQSVTIPASTSGVFQDTTNTDSVASGDLINSEIATGATGTSLILLLASYTLEDPTGTVYPLLGAGSDGSTTRNTVSVRGINGGSFGASLAQFVQYRVRTTITFSNFRLNILSNGISDSSTFTFQVGGSDVNQTVTVAGSTSGEFEDTTNVDTVSPNNLVNVGISTGMGAHGDTSMVWSPMQLHGDSAARPSVGAGNQIGLVNGLSNFTGLEQTPRITSTDENFAKVEARNAYDISNLFFRVSSNSLDVASIHSLRVNGASSALSISVPAGDIGFFEDTTNTVSVVPTDEINIEGDATASTVGSAARRTISVQVQESVATAAITGTAAEDADENDVVDGGLTIIITLASAAWDADVGADNVQTQDLIDGLDSNLAEATGWNAEVRDALTFAAVTRDSDTVVTILLPAFGDYDITAAETITVTVPASALDIADPITATPTFEIAALGGAFAGPVTVQQRQLLMV